MPAPFNLAISLDASLQAAATAAGLETPFAAEVRGADPRHGDFQANGVLGYAKARKLNPRTVAQQLVGALPAEVTSAYEVAIAGPGFINLRVEATLYHQVLHAALSKGADSNWQDYLRSIFSRHLPAFPAAPWFPRQKHPLRIHACERVR